MHEYYLEAAEKVSNLANEYSTDYNLSTILMVGSAKIAKLANEDKGLIFKIGSSDQKLKERNINQ